jgi:hypothetical protein
MKEENKKSNSENFSDDSQENLRIENEILKLKMQAERDAVFGGNMKDLPPEAEAEFLKNVQQFEDSFDKAREITIYECIGQPDFKKTEELKPEDVKIEVTRLMELLHSKNIILEVMGQYELSVIYKFITEELFREKIREINHPGYLHSFVYEEFHPNHNIDIARTAQDFINHWFEKGFDENSFEFASQIITADGKVFLRNELLEKIHQCQDSYKQFTNIKFKGSDTSFEWDEKEGKGLGHAEGMFSYTAEIESGEIIHMEGPFKLYMINETGQWQIFYFVFPGFVW